MGSRRQPTFQRHELRLYASTYVCCHYWEEKGPKFSTGLGFRLFLPIWAGLREPSEPNPPPPPGGPPLSTKKDGGSVGSALPSDHCSFIRAPALSTRHPSTCVSKFHQHPPSRLPTIGSTLDCIIKRTIPIAQQGESRALRWGSGGLTHGHSTQTLLHCDLNLVVSYLCRARNSYSPLPGFGGCCVNTLP